MQRGPRVATIALALVGAMLLVLAVEASPWWQAAGASISPIASKQCFESDCSDVSLRWIGAEAIWYRAGAATYASGLFAAVIALFVAGAAASGRAYRVAGRVGLVACACALGAAIVFHATLPRLPGLVASRGGPIFAVGALLGAAACLVVLRTARMRGAPPGRPDAGQAS